MAIIIKTITTTIKMILNAIEYIKPIINNLIILIKTAVYVINCSDRPSLYDMFNNIYKILLIINNIIKTIIAVCVTAKSFYTTITRLIYRLWNK